MSTDTQYLDRYAGAGNLYAQTCDDLGIDPDDSPADTLFEEDFAAMLVLLAEIRALDDEVCYTMLGAAHDWTRDWLIENGHIRIISKEMAGGVSPTNYTLDMVPLIRALTDEAPQGSLLGFDDPPTAALYEERHPTGEMPIQRDTVQLDTDRSVRDA